MTLTRRELAPCAIAPFLAAPAFAATPRLRIAMGRDANDRRYDFARDLLLLALDAAGQSAALQPVLGLSQLRIERELADGNLDVGCRRSGSAQQGCCR